MVNEMSRIQEVLVVLPKLSSYEFKDDGMKREMLKRVRENVSEVRQYTSRTCMFAEDFLALTLFGEDKDVVWESAISEGDQYYMQTKGRVPAAYAKIVRRQNTDLLIKSVRKYKISKVGEGVLGKTKTRMYTILERKRFVADTIIDESKLVLYFDNNNNFCKRPTSALGDGRMLILVDCKFGVVQYIYGGMQLSKADWELVMKGVCVE